MAIHFSQLMKSVRSGNYYFSRHADRERQNDGFFVEEVEEAILTGKIIEQYPDTGRGASCLVVGFTRTGKPLHAVMGMQGKTAVVVTVYVPKPPKFSTPFERGKK
jgi:hypothetical protein